MVMKHVKRIGAIVGIAALVGACADTSPVSPPADELATFAAAVTIPSTGLAQAVWVCKDAPSGSFDFTVSGSGMNIIQAAPIIDAGNCTKVADAGGGNAITVTELPETGYNFSHIIAYYVPLGTNTLVADAANPVSTPTITRTFGDLGRVFVFHNVLPPSTGCTLTLGYWKTHNETFPGGAPVDPTWDLLPGGLAEGTTFFLSAMTWYQVFWTPVGGNAYYNLAHQYMAAKLNILAGADPSAVSAAITSAETLFNTYTPAQIGVLKGSNSLRQQFIALAGTLGSYNEGLTGPGHCSGGPVDF